MREQRILMMCDSSLPFRRAESCRYQGYDGHLDLKDSTLDTTTSGRSRPALSLCSARSLGKARRIGGVGHRVQGGALGHAASRQTGPSEKVICGEWHTVWGSSGLDLSNWGSRREPGPVMIPMKYTEDLFLIYYDGHLNLHLAMNLCLSISGSRQLLMKAVVK